MLTYDEVAERFAVSKDTVRELVKRKALPVVRMSKKIHRFREADVEHFIKRRATGIHNY